MSATITLTELEANALELCLNSDSREGQLSDNYSNGGPTDFAKELGLSMQAVGGLITSLQNKGLGWLDDREGEFDFDPRTGKRVPYGVEQHIFWLSDDGVNAIFDHLANKSA